MPMMKPYYSWEQTLLYLLRNYTMNLSNILHYYEKTI